MQLSNYTILENSGLVESVYRIRLAGITDDISAPGQFVNVLIDGHYLRRPISVCDVDPGVITLIYKVVGAGTADLAKKEPGEKLSVLTGLGNGYDLSVSGERPLLIGGGVGVPPMYYLARKLIGQGRGVTVAMGCNRKEDIFYADEFRALGAGVVIATLDGSFGIKGTAVDAIRDLDYTYFYACGPEPMLKALWKCAKTSGQLSFERRMGCGFGACMGCSCRTIAGEKRICKDGPVLTREEILWED